MADRKRTDVDWQDVRVFLALARSGSLSAAARMLSVNHATISRRLRALEARLGEALVERRPEGYVLTPAGTHALEAAGDMEQAARLLGRGASSEAARGLVRVSAPPALATGFLASRLPTLVIRHPLLDVELSADHRVISLDRHEADIAIRFGRLTDSDLIARPLVTVHYGFYGTDEVCRSIEAGEQTAFVGFDEANAHLREATWVGRHFPRARLAFRARDQYTQALAAGLGAGIVLLPHYLGRGVSGLRVADMGPTPPGKDVFLLTRRRDRQNPAVRTTAEEISNLFSYDRALFASY